MTTHGEVKPGHVKAGCAPAPGTDQVRVDELLEALFYLREENQKATEEATLSRLDDQKPKEVLSAATAIGQVSVEPSGLLALTPEGEARAMGIVRRHRLAEILFTQVLEVPEEEIEPNACEMEHILSTSVTDSVCAFLGHPPRCPHGRAIPPGECCRAFTKQVKPLVIPLSELDVGRPGTVVFISTRRDGLLTRLADLGVVPGAKTHLLQRYPSYVVQVGETSLALEQKIVQEIYVRREL